MDVLDGLAAGRSAVVDQAKTVLIHTGDARNVGESPEDGTQDGFSVFLF